jgi:trk system potassium uptake protein TrkA
MLGRSKRSDDAVVVCGLGRFGSATADALARLGHDVLAIDRDPRLVAEWSSRLPHVVEADTTSHEAMEQLGITDFAVGVVGIGTSVESSVLTVVTLVDLGVKQLWAKALTEAHGRILERLGVHHIVYPEHDSGQRVAHLVTGRLMDYIEFDDGFAIAKMRPPAETHGFTLTESKVREKYGITVVGVKTPGRDFTYAVPETRVYQQDVMIVSGRSELIEKFAARP